ncbi:TrkH family potassium uptake protein [Amycolatopsis aidingensis]|uniref:TrkH family potassium uptake protein n=1 Tax=Amycolatopsis aidingensis TaxID=2842453 RepID=UPI001E4D20E6|nr:potassium transporter TrkG [Amycolatopsis aidingensis]
MKTGIKRRAATVRHPARLVVLGFGVAVVAGTVLLSLPVATEGGPPLEVVTALFTATSAVCVTGLVVVDTAGHWSTFGELVVLGLIQVGGLGIMTLASLLGMLVARRLGLRMRLGAQAETKSLRLGDIGRVVVGVLRLSLVFEVLTAAVLSMRFMTGYGRPLGEAIYLGVFHAISAFNNAGFALWPDSLTAYATDAWIVVPVMIALVSGGLGFPVLFELGRRMRHHRRGRAGIRWSLHTKITLLVSAVLLVVGTVAVLAMEWSNPATMGPRGVLDKLLLALFHGATPRTAGFNTLDVGELRPATLLVNDILMFIGGGSAGTAGGIKVTTFALLAFVILAEIRGEPTVHVMGRRLANAVQRQAITVALLGVGAVVAGTAALLLITPFDLDRVLFEVVSAFGTVGLSTGITAELPVAGQLLLVGLMFLGRLGPITLASALALRERGRRYELPEERPIVG